MQLISATRAPTARWTIAGQAKSSTQNWCQPAKYKSDFALRLEPTGRRIARGHVHYWILTSGPLDLIKTLENLMPHQLAYTRTETLVSNMTFSIKGASLNGVDPVTLATPTQTLEGVIVERGPLELTLQFGDRRLVCRPWHLGDIPAPRLAGTSSTWTVERHIDRVDTLTEVLSEH